jgi:hypothetical protein
MSKMTRRGFFAAAAVAAVTPAFAGEQASSSSQLLVTKDPNCGCCSGWVDHIRGAGFEAKVVESRDLAPLKIRLGVPNHLASCHTAQIGGYVVEGHVPAAAVKRLLAERPQATGLAVPGMPAGSPGMEVSGVANERYAVILFGPSGERTFATFQGIREL